MEDFDECSEWGIVNYLTMELMDQSMDEFVLRLSLTTDIFFKIH